MQIKGLAIQFIKCQTYKIARLAVEQDGMSLHYIWRTYYDHDLADIAIRQNKLAERYLKTVRCRW